ncbi:unnamed protein product [Paramecium sonneborni]|uniref:Uncharacterized protein n=1 Tax=Paramecium sonneborni TaxID=65129 RepID=A0A8S1KDL1_9CILI|nr:unnamed protein product [Paramecium sonneborni]
MKTVKILKLRIFLLSHRVDQDQITDNQKFQYLKKNFQILLSNITEKVLQKNLILEKINIRYLFTSYIRQEIHTYLKQGHSDKFTVEQAFQLQSLQQNTKFLQNSIIISQGNKPKFFLLKVK